jgi:hypothetical protein
MIKQQLKEVLPQSKRIKLDIKEIRDFGTLLSKVKKLKEAYCTDIVGKILAEIDITYAEGIKIDWQFVARITQLQQRNCLDIAVTLFKKYAQQEKIEVDYLREKKLFDHMVELYSVLGRKQFAAVCDFFGVAYENLQAGFDGFDAEENQLVFLQLLLRSKKINVKVQKEALRLYNSSIDPTVNSEKTISLVRNILRDPEVGVDIKNHIMHQYHEDIIIPLVRKIWQDLEVGVDVKKAVIPYFDWMTLEKIVEYSQLLRDSEKELFESLWVEYNKTSFNVATLKTFYGELDRWYRADSPERVDIFAQLLSGFVGFERRSCAKKIEQFISHSKGMNDTQQLEFVRHIVKIIHEAHKESYGEMIFESEFLLVFESLLKNGYSPAAVTCFFRAFTRKSEVRKTGWISNCGPIDHFSEDTRVELLPRRVCRILRAIMMSGPKYSRLADDIVKQHFMQHSKYFGKQPMSEDLALCVTHDHNKSRAHKWSIAYGKKMDINALRVFIVKIVQSITLAKGQALQQAKKNVLWVVDQIKRNKFDAQGVISIIPEIMSNRSKKNVGHVYKIVNLLVKRCTVANTKDRIELMDALYRYYPIDAVLKLVPKAKAHEDFAQPLEPLIERFMAANDSKAVNLVLRNIRATTRRKHLPRKFAANIFQNAEKIGLLKAGYLFELLLKLRWIERETYGSELAELMDRVNGFRTLVRISNRKFYEAITQAYFCFSEKGAVDKYVDIKKSRGFGGVWIVENQSIDDSVLYKILEYVSGEDVVQKCRTEIVSEHAKSVTIIPEKVAEQKEEGGDKPAASPAL